MAGIIKSLSSIRCPTLPPLSLMYGFQYVSVRTFFPDDYTGMTKFREVRQNYKATLRGKEEAFWDRLEDMNKQNRSFESDAKIACYIAEREHLPLVKSSTKRLLRTHNRSSIAFRFGPVIMRLGHELQSPDFGLEMFYDEEMQKQFSSFKGYIVLLDLLFDSGMYEEVVRVFETILDMEWTGSLLSASLTLPYILSLYKIGSMETWEKADKFWKSLPFQPTRRMILAYAAIQLQRKNPQEAVRLVNAHVQDYYLSQNLNIQAYVMLGQWQLVQNLLSKTNDVTKDTYNVVKKCEESSENHPNVKSVLENLSKKTILTQTVEEALCAPLVVKQMVDDDTLHQTRIKRLEKRIKQDERSGEMRQGRSDDRSYNRNEERSRERNKEKSHERYKERMQEKR